MSPKTNQLDLYIPAEDISSRGARCQDAAARLQVAADELEE